MRNQPLYNILLGLAILVAVVLIAMVLITSKGDAMSGGGQIRTTFKGRATVDDQIARVNGGLAGLFVLLMIALDWLG